MVILKLKKFNPKVNLADTVSHKKSLSLIAKGSPLDWRIFCYHWRISSDTCHKLLIFLTNCLWLALSGCGRGWDTLKGIWKCFMAYVLTFINGEFNPSEMRWPPTVWHWTNRCTLCFIFSKLWGMISSTI